MSGLGRSDGGTDLVRSAVSWKLWEHLENLELTGRLVADGTGNNAANRLTGNSAANKLSGYAGADTLEGGAGADTLICGSGNDILQGGFGSDRLDGSIGVDTATYVDATAGVTVRLWNGTGSNNIAAGDLLIDIENLTGSSFGDVLVGANAAVVL